MDCDFHQSLLDNILVDTNDDIYILLHFYDQVLMNYY